MSHKQCVACRLVKAADEFSRNTTKTSGLQSQCKSCRKTIRAEKRRVDEAELAEAAEVAAIKKRQHSSHQKHYRLPWGRTGAERLQNFYEFPPRVDETAVLITVKLAMAELWQEWRLSGLPVPADPLGIR